MSFADALLHMPKFASTFKSLLSNKEKLFELANTPLNVNCSAILLKKLPKKLGDPGKFVIPCDFPRMVECLALANLGASINLMPISVWKKLSLLELTTTRISLELADQNVTHPMGVAEDVSSNILKKCLDFPVFPRVEIPLRPRILFFLLLPLRSLLLKELILEEIETFLHTPDEFTNLDNDYHDTEGDILYLEKLLNEDPTPDLPLMKTEELKQTDVTMTKPSIEEPPKLELKDLPPHLEYAYLGENNKFPIIIAKDLKDEEKTKLLNVLKSHKRAITWQVSDIKGIDPRFCTHKILMEDYFKPAVQHQRKANPKIHEVIKKEVIKLLDAGLIYPIFDSPWVSPVHCVPKKGGMTVVANEENELIPTQFVTGWRVCIDYRKLNDATRKDHFSLPFMDQMLERLEGNEYYCFRDVFSGYFQIPIDPQDQEKTTFTCPYRTFAHRRMPFGLCNAPGTFQ
ncbi:DNA-directed DNA polymerase, partial [Tanacetum coccineum]